MKPITLLDKIAITVHARRILQIILLENPTLEKILHFSANETEALNAVRNWILPKLKKNPIAEEFYMSEKHNIELVTLLSWENLAAIRILDYINHAGDEYPDQNIGGEIAITNPIKMLWLATNFGIGGAKPGFFTDMLQLLRQLNGKLLLNPPTKKQLLSWMERYPSGIDPKIIELRKINKTRIIKILIDKIDNREIPSRTYHFKPGLSFKQ